MKAYVRTSIDTLDVILAEKAIPSVMPQEVLVAVKAFGVGVHDRYFIPAQAKLPYTIGTEGSGVIEAVGTDVLKYSKGERVVFTSALQPQGGSWAEYVTVPSTALYVLPETLTFAQGAALPIAGEAALQCMRELELEKDNTLFIAGASGAIGSIVIQLATSKGIRVAASASAKNHEYMKSLGAEKTVDYNDPQWIQEILKWMPQGVDAALAIQPGTGIETMYTVSPGGTLITVSGDHQQIPTQRGIRIKQMQHNEATRAKLAHLLQDVAQGKIRSTIEQEFSFNHAIQALEKVETRHARGKVVVTLS